MSSKGDAGRMLGGMLGGTVEFAVPVEVAFDYLADPVNRPRWQASLRRVEQVEGTPRQGQTWTDVTVPGMRPSMRATVFDRPTAWAETGTWRFVRADLALGFRPAGQRCSVDVRFRITGPGPLAAVGLALTAAAVPAVLADVRRAARILAE